MTRRGTSAGRPRAGAVVIAACAVATAAVSLVPVGYLFATGISLHDIVEQFRYPATVAAVWQTIELTVVISLLTVVLGVAGALLVVRTTLPFPRLFTVLFALPLAVPGFVSAYAAYSTELTYAPRLGAVTSFGGAAMVMALTLYPYVFLPCVVALRRVDPAQEDIVRSLRPQAAAVFRCVVLPALRPAIGAGGLIVALHVLAEYGAMVQLGRSTLTTKIMAEMLDYGDYRSARSLSLLLTALSALVLLATRFVSGPGARGYLPHGAVRPPQRRPLGALRLPAMALGLAVPFAAVGPTVLMTTRGLLRAGGRAQLDWGQVGQAAATTLGYAVVTALVATAVGLPVSWWLSRRPSAAALATERAVWVAHAIPGAILALALVYLATRAAPSLYKTPAILIAAYVILFVPLAIANQRVGLDATRQAYDDVAASLGSGPLRRFARVSAPLALPGFLAGALLVGLDASKELTTTLMLIPYNSQTLSTQLWATTNGESLDFSAAAPYGGALVLLGIPPVWLLVRQVLRHVEPAARGAAARSHASRTEAPRARLARVAG